MNYDFFVLSNVYVLQYIIEPNTVAFYKNVSTDTKLIYTLYKPDALRFYSRVHAERAVEYIKNLFGIEFQIVNLCEV